MVEYDLKNFFKRNICFLFESSHPVWEHQNG